VRLRTKECFKCTELKEALYRCRFTDLKDWVFLCGDCLDGVKTMYADSYQYGGTWKSKKK
jgi:hypothetical protein